jgi:glycerol-3-phosphate cytidylyltransferase-like family protein
MLENLSLVDEVLIYDNINQTEILKRIKPNILVQ